MFFYLDKNGNDRVFLPNFDYLCFAARGKEEAKLNAIDFIKRHIDMYEDIYVEHGQGELVEIEVSDEK